MSIKILGGVARNFELATPKVSTTRPTSVLLKRRLFDSTQHFQDYIFIDLCAGSGSVGFEALSRGASKVILVENLITAFRCLTENKKKMNDKYPNLGEIQISNDDFKRWLSKNHNLLSNNPNIFIFFDPPYEKIDLYEELFNSIREIPFKGRLVVEACKQKTMTIDEFTAKFGEIDKLFKQGTSYFAIYDF